MGENLIGFSVIIPFRGNEMEPDKIIKSVVKDMNANKTVEQIAKRNGVDVQLVEDILQIYTTHPGIDVDGILDRLSYYGY